MPEILVRFKFDDDFVSLCRREDGMDPNRSWNIGQRLGQLIGAGVEQGVEIDLSDVIPEVRLYCSGVRKSE